MVRERPVAPFMTVMQSRIKQPQFFWFLGHFMVLYHGLKIHMRLFGLGNADYHYRWSLVYLSITYGIVLYQFVKSGQLGFQLSTIRKRLHELDTLQYFVLLMSLYFLSFGGFIDLNILNSLHIYSFFHCINYFKDNLLPFISVIPMTSRTALTKLITDFIAQSNRMSLRIAHDFEMCCVLSLSIRVVYYALAMLTSGTSRCRFVGALIYVWFFKLRYIQNQQLRIDVDNKVAMVESSAYLSQHPVLHNLWFQAKSLFLTIIHKLPA